MCQGECGYGIVMLTMEAVVNDRGGRVEGYGGGGKGEINGMQRDDHW